MKWRCTRCGKPHATNEPPCDNCGHNAFEKAVVRADVDEVGQGATGTRVGPAPETVDTGPEYVWACTNCGRRHVRNTPPCSRCGNPDLEMTERTYEDVERDLVAPSWFAVAKPYLPVLAAIGVLAALFATGIVSPSVLPGIGPPSPPDAPGTGTEAAGIDLEATERAVHDHLESERESSGRRTYDDGLAAYAEYRNRLTVAVEFDDEDPRSVDPSRFGHDCGDSSVVSARMTLAELSIRNYTDESDLGSAVAGELLSAYGDDVRIGYDAEGLDVHRAPNGDVYVTYAAC